MTFRIGLIKALAIVAAFWGVLWAGLGFYLSTACVIAALGFLFATGIVTIVERK